MNEFNSAKLTPFQTDKILKVESVYDDYDYISLENLIKMIKQNNNTNLTSNQKERIEEQYALNQISNNDLALYKEIFPDFIDDLKKKYKPIQKHSNMYKPLNRKIHRRYTSKYKKKTKSKTGKKKPKSL